MIENRGDSKALNTHSNNLEIKKENIEKTPELLGEALPLSHESGHIPPGVLKMMGKFLNHDIEISPSAYSKSRFTIFGSDIVGTHEKAAIIARDLVLTASPLDDVKKIIEENPAVLLCCVEAKDPCGRRIQGTLYQMALGAGDVDFKINAGKHDGMAEMLKELVKKYYGEEEASYQYAKQFPPDWESEEKIKEEKDVVIVKTLFENFLALEKKEDEVELRKACQKELDGFKNYLKQKSEALISSGKHFQLDMLLCALALSEHGDYVNFGTEKNNLWANEVVGAIQRILPACDAEIFKSGVYNVFLGNGKMVFRTLKFTDDSNYFDQTGEYVLGVNCHLNIFGGVSKDGEGFDGDCYDALEKMYYEKKVELESLGKDERVVFQP